jgi:hypothetical protein
MHDKHVPIPIFHHPNIAIKSPRKVAAALSRNTNFKNPSSTKNFNFNQVKMATAKLAYSKN